MTRKAAAALLLLLITSPFTTPFETCDVTMLLGTQVSQALSRTQVTLAWTVQEDAHAIAPGTAAARRLRVGLKLTPNAPGSRSGFGADVGPDNDARCRAASAVSPQTSPPPLSSLRI